MNKIKLLLLLLFCQTQIISAADNLAQLADKTLKRNLQLKISTLEMEQSFIDEKTALNALIPDLSFSATKSHTTFKDSFQRNSPSSIDSMLSYSLKLTQSYPGLGRIPVIKRQISKLKTRIKEAAKTKQKVQVLRQLTKVFFQLVREQELVKVHKTDLVLIAEVLKIAQLNFEVGLVLKNDILRIEVEQLNSKSNLIKNENGFHDLHFDLAAILDYQSIDELDLDLPAGLKFAAGPFTTELLLQKLYETDSDIKLAELDVEILRKAEKAARSAHLPTLTFDGSYNHGRKLGPIEGTRDVKATFILTTPIYNGNDIENAVRLAQKTRKIATLRLQDLKNQKKATLEKAIADYNETLVRISFAEKMIEQSYENMRIVFTRYQEGASSIVELVDAQRILTNSAQSAIKTYYEERERYIAILLLLHDFENIYKADNQPSPLNFDFLLQQLHLSPGDN